MITKLLILLFGVLVGAYIAYPKFICECVDCRRLNWIFWEDLE